MTKSLVFTLHLKVDAKLITVQSVRQERVRVYSESFEENLIFLIWHNSAIQHILGMLSTSFSAYSVQSVQQERVLVFSKTIRDFETFFFFNKSILEGLRRYYLIDSPVPIVVQNGLAPFRHAFH